MSLRGLEVDDRGLAERTGTGTGPARARLGHVLAAFDRADTQAHPAAQATEAPVAGSGRRHMIFLADRPGRSQWPLPPTRDRRCNGNCLLVTLNRHQQAIEVASDAVASVITAFGQVFGRDHGVGPPPTP